MVAWYYDESRGDVFAGCPDVARCVWEGAMVYAYGVDVDGCGASEDDVSECRCESFAVDDSESAVWVFSSYDDWDGACSVCVGGYE